MGCPRSIVRGIPLVLMLFAEDYFFLNRAHKSQYCVASPPKSKRAGERGGGGGVGSGRRRAGASVGLSNSAQWVSESFISGIERVFPKHPSIP